MDFLIFLAAIATICLGLYLFFNIGVFILNISIRQSTIESIKWSRKFVNYGYDLIRRAKTPDQIEVAIGHTLDVARKNTDTNTQWHWYRDELRSDLRELGNARTIELILESTEKELTSSVN